METITTFRDQRAYIQMMCTGCGVIQRHTFAWDDETHHQTTDIWQCCDCGRCKRVSHSYLNSWGRTAYEICRECGVASVGRCEKCR